MKVILQQDVKGQGKAGQLVNVADGYARNFLLPRKLAVEATDENISVMKKQEKVRQKKMESEKALALETASRLEALVVKIPARSGGAGGKLFGAITSKEISETLLEQHGVDIEKNKIIQEEHIKTFGLHEVKCKLGFETTGVINILVVEA
ncbi:MAG: 50S ribosomal protein L9 [Oscillospiraceae bacterium]|jgi:large subunit ribosomal protein L9|nr:50S ribosomal protein L9 [Oscillospiraceae bacterium]